MSLKDLIDKYEGSRLDTTGWFKLKSDCEGCIYNTGDTNHCLIYLAESGKEKPSGGCKHFTTGKEAVEIAQSDRGDR